MDKSGHNLYTIGHSNRSIEEFIEILKAHKIEQIVDVRSIPRSRHNPQFNKDDLAKSLRNRHINYRLMKDLGGFRYTTKDSINKGWENSSFRGFADYMQTVEFDAALEKLIIISSKKSTAIMCAESVPWRCHRSLIADAVTIRGIKVKDIFSKTNMKEHTITTFARVNGRKVFYPKDENII